jgi:hypothetical protein
MVYKGVPVPLDSMDLAIAEPLCCSYRIICMPGSEYSLNPGLDVGTIHGDFCAASEASISSGDIKIHSRHLSLPIASRLKTLSTLALRTGADRTPI